MANGFQAGMWPERSSVPRKQWLGSQRGRTSKCWTVTFPRNANWARTINTEAAMRSGPAASRIPLDRSHAVRRATASSDARELKRSPYLPDPREGYVAIGPFGLAPWLRG